MSNEEYPQDIQVSSIPTETHEKTPNLSTLENTQNKALEAMKVAFELQRQFEISINQGTTREEGLTVRQEEFTEKLGEYMHAISIQPEDPAFNNILRRSYYDIGSTTPELTFTESVKQELGNSIEGEHVFEAGHITQNGVRENFFLRTITTIGGSIIIGGNIDGYRRLQEGEIDTLGFQPNGRREITQSRIAPRSQIDEKQDYTQPKFPVLPQGQL